MFTLQVSIDCQLTLTYTNDIVANIFSANPMITWGFTSATGSKYNLQQFCYAPPLNFTIASTNELCNGQCNGVAAVTNITGSTGPYSYLWNNGQYLGLAKN